MKYPTFRIVGLEVDPVSTHADLIKLIGPGAPQELVTDNNKEINYFGDCAYRALDGEWNLRDKVWTLQAIMDLPSTQTIISTDTYGTGEMGFSVRMGYRSGYSIYLYKNNGLTYSNSFPLLVPTQFNKPGKHHYAFVYTGSVIQLYVDYTYVGTFYIPNSAVGDGFTIFGEAKGLPDIFFKASKLKCDFLQFDYGYTVPVEDFYRPAASVPVEVAWSFFNQEAVPIESFDFTKLSDVKFYAPPLTVSDVESGTPIIPLLNSANAAIGGITYSTTASSTYSSLYGYKVFSPTIGDDATTAYWRSLYATDQWLQLYTGSPLTINGYRLSAHAQATIKAFRPASWKLKGSHDGAAWDLLHEVSNVTAADEKDLYYLLEDTYSYEYYRLDNINAIGENNYVVIQNFELFNIPSKPGMKTLNYDDASLDLLDVPVSAEVGNAIVGFRYDNVTSNSKELVLITDDSTEIAAGTIDAGNSAFSWLSGSGYLYQDPTNGPMLIPFEYSNLQDIGTDHHLFTFDILDDVSTYGKFSSFEMAYTNVTGTSVYTLFSKAYALRHMLNFSDSEVSDVDLGVINPSTADDISFGPGIYYADIQVLMQGGMGRAYLMDAKDNTKIFAESIPGLGTNSSNYLSNSTKVTIKGFFELDRTTPLGIYVDGGTYSVIVYGNGFTFSEQCKLITGSIVKVA